jgi:TolA-binding protein
MAEAHYYYGMCLVNEGNVADAKTALQKYLQLAPNGPNAATAKSILDSMQ